MKSSNLNRNDKAGDFKSELKEFIIKTHKSKRESNINILNK